MAWVNLLAKYPDATINISKRGDLIDPNDYESNGIELHISGGRITMTAPDIDSGGGSYSVELVVDGGSGVSDEVRIVDVISLAAGGGVPFLGSVAECYSHEGYSDSQENVSGADVVQFSMPVRWNLLTVAALRKGG